MVELFEITCKYCGNYHSVSVETENEINTERAKIRVAAVCELLDKARTDILHLAGNMPDDFDLREVREVIADYASDQIAYLKLPKNRKPAYLRWLASLLGAPAPRPERK